VDNEVGVETISIRTEGDTWTSNEYGDILRTTPEGQERHIGTVFDDGSIWKGRIFGTYIAAEGSSKEVVSAMLITGYIAAKQNRPGEFPF
jgi:hypothetical protein